MRLRKYRTSDCGHLAELFYHTVHSVNAKDYTKEQLDAWATGIVDLKQWDASFLKHHTVVAVENHEIVGFGDMDDSGYLDRLFVHQDHQGKGIASAICMERKERHRDAHRRVFFPVASSGRRKKIEKVPVVHAAGVHQNGVRRI